MLPTPSHAVDSFGETVVIRGLELFVGFDPSIDDPEDDRIKKYDREAVDRVVERTRQYMGRGQTPKLILGHNQDGSGSTKPSIGDIISVSMALIGGTPGIVGDVQMSADNFAAYLKSNSYPRRSAEIWKDGFLSEVALLGSETPARPIPDTRFTRAAAIEVGQVDRFAREFAATFAEPTAGYHAPGPGNTHIPTTRDTMDHDQTIKELQAKLDEVTKDRDDMKVRLAKFMGDHGDPKRNAHDDGKDKDDNSRRIAALEGQVEQFQKSAETKDEQLAQLGEQFIRERAGNQVELMAQQGYRIGNDGDRKDLIDRIVSAKDPVAEVEFWRKRLPRDNPIGVILDQSHLMGVGGEKELTLTQRTLAANAAQDRCVAEEKPEMFGRFLAEEQDKLAGKAGEKVA